MNYVGEEKLFAWYHAVAKPPRLSDGALLTEVYQQFVDTGRQEFILPAAKTLTGQIERYAFVCENVGACGASTGFMYF